MKRDETRWGRFRNWLAYKIASFALGCIATPWYAAMIGGSVRLGLDAASKGDEG